jgi:hypothetical protein
MNQIRSIKHKSINTGKSIVDAIYNTEELAKEALIDISDSALVEPEDDPFERRSACDNKLPSSTFKKALAHVSTFT